MIKKLLLAVLAVGLFAVQPLPVLAFDAIGPGVCQQGVTDGAAACNDADTSDNPLTGQDGIIMRIVNIVAIIGGGAAVIFIILAGLRFITSGGGSEDIAGARRTIVYALIGLIVIALSRTLVAFIIGRI